MLQVRRVGAGVQRAARSTSVLRCALRLTAPRPAAPSMGFRTAPTVALAKAEKKDAGGGFFTSS